MKKQFNKVVALGLAGAMLCATISAVFVQSTTAKAATDKVFYVSVDENFANTSDSDGNFKKIQDAIDAADSNATIYVRPGKYNEHITFNNSGSNASIQLIGEVQGEERPVIDGTDIQVATKEWSPLVHINNQSNVTLKNLVICNNSAKGKEEVLGILVEGNSDNVTIDHCKVCDITTNYSTSKPNAFGILVAGNTSDSLDNIKITNNEVCDLKLGQSESLVLNGNVTNFEVSNNKVHDNDNIGIDFIGYEDMYEKGGENDRARDGKCLNNLVYNISSGSNKTYSKDGLCADGIYVDGGKNIEISGNVVHNCDIGIEAASEHDNKATEFITITNNLIYDCEGYAGISFGGSGETNGTAKNITISNNTVCNNNENLVIQKANDASNVVSKNVFYQNGDNENVNYDDSLKNKTKNVILGNVFVQKDDLHNVLLNNSNLKLDVTFKDVANGDYTVVSSTIGKDMVFDFGYTKSKVGISDSNEGGTTEAPATEAPVTEAPATETPTTEAPTTEAPATEAPTTEAPTTEEVAPADELCDITIDGKDTDWKDYKSIAAAGDIKSVKVDSDDSYLYYCVRVSTFNKGYSLFINADNNKKTDWSWEKMDKSALKVSKSSKVVEIRLDAKVLDDIEEEHGIAFNTLGKNYKTISKVTANIK